MLRDGAPIGVIVVTRPQPGHFSDSEIELLKTFADQAVIAIENARLFEAEQSRAKDLQESLEYQTATSEVLSVISRSPNELQPVLDTILETAQRLCQSDRAQFFFLENGKYHPAAHKGTDPEFVNFLRDNPISAEAGTPSPTGRAARERRTIHVPDVAADAEVARWHLERGAKGKSILAVPLIRGGLAIGVITLAQMSVRPFTERQIELVKVFADQAVIAIENTRLFEAEQARTNELKESLEYQTAASAVLNVISRSKSDVQPVFDAIVRSAAELFHPCAATITTREGSQILWRASATRHNVDRLEQMARTAFPVPFDPERSPSARAMLEQRIIEIPDVSALERNAVRPAAKEFTRSLQVAGVRSIAFVPLLHTDEGIGTIILGHPEPGFRLSQKQRALVQTFADQAVIAIENARLFEAEQASKRELTESLEYQTAISEVLGVISRSPTDAQPVFQSIAQSAAQLCGAQHCNVYRFDGRLIYFAATHLVPGMPPEAREANMRQPPIAPGRGNAAARSIAYGTVAEIPDIDADPDYERRDVTGVSNLHSTMAVPMLKDGRPIGAIVVSRSEKGRFSDRQIDLLKTFADQAVIAVENTRLFEEVQARTRELTESLTYQTATSEVLNVISRSKFDLQPVLDTIARTACTLCDEADSTIQLREGDGLRTVAHYGPLAVGAFRSLDRSWVPGRAVVDRSPIHVHDLLTAQQEFPLGYEIAKRHGHRTSLAIPLLRDGFAIGSFLLRRSVVRAFTDREIALLQTFADQAVIAIENTRLFDEIVQKGRELEIASQHKSQFVANMSHELRTPLAAMLGYAELMQEGFYEPQGPKALDALTRIRSNGKHLLGLINTVLDIAKIESGQFTLNVAEYAMDSVVETVRVATEALAQNKRLALKTDVAKSLPIGFGDEQRLTQVLLNLVGNAIKFTDAGEVRVTARAINGHFAVSVADTGPGIPEYERSRIFEQFHQVDSSNTKAKGGTGLGLAIAKQIVEMHGGRIWVESTLGKGSTFQMELPTRADFQKRAP
jgi:signal transduction histidine kinase/putative methionine-R-sulfoxide reductase with GAF domain